MPTRDVRLIQLAPAVIHALAARDLPGANRAAAAQLEPVHLTPAFVDPGWQSTWRMRSAQIDADPSCLPWITRAVLDLALGVVGRAGFHGPPDDDGMVEVGYAIDPAYRRRGCARAALEAMLDHAWRVPAVRTVRASISPDNEPSRLLVLQYGFTEVGEQEDDEDGLEIVYEVSAGTAVPASAGSPAWR